MRPVMPSLRGLASHTASGAMSSGSYSEGTMLMSSVMRVLAMGAMALTKTPALRPSSAKVRVKPAMPALAAA